ncbi:hypothetical protein JW887_02850 [Candidatus Dojkabacteria bacterium]|nr:hypothetical protein [Candidatus Dojkabacteria bacterium]
MSAQSLRTRFPQKYQYIKVIAKERWPHIKIEEKTFKEDIKGMRNQISDSQVYWLIVINKDLSDEDKYLTLIHELIHCTIDEAKLLEKVDEEKLILQIERELKDSFEKQY